MSSALLRDQLARYDSQTNAQRDVVSAPASVIDGGILQDDVELPFPAFEASGSIHESTTSYASSVLSPVSPVSDDFNSPLSSGPSSLDGDALTQPAPSNCRVNEHLAVLIPRHLWKADRLASRCERYSCRVKFTFLERKHHCRRCGGVFCQACSARTTPLLDASKLSFILPPHGVPITHYASPQSPVIDARVCDECYDQVHGRRIPNRVRTAPSSPKPLASIPSTSSLSTLPPSTPFDERSLSPVYESSFNHHRYYAPLCPPVQPTKLEGPLDKYPLKDPLHTRINAPRWERIPYIPRWNGRLPDGRLQYELEAERGEAEEAAEQERLNSVIVGFGEISVGKPAVPTPKKQRSLGEPRRTYTLPTY